MAKTIVHEHQLSPSIASVALWTAIALLAGCVLALTGLPGVYAVLALALLVVFGVAAARYPAPVLAAAIWCLGLCPFVWGLETGGVLPKLFGDESLLLLYLAVSPFLYLFTTRLACPGFNWLYVVLVLYVCTEALSFAIAPLDLIAFRNFLETVILGPMLLVLVLNEMANSEPEKIGPTIVWLTTAIAALSIVERIAQRNPIVEDLTPFTFMSAQLAQLTEGFYRPYVTFFHPSEAGTFMALGVPFAVRNWTQRKSVASVMVLAVIVGGLLVNATRGAWAGVAVAVLLLSRNVWKLLAKLALTGAVGTGFIYFVLGNTPFVRRLTDPNNLYGRFEYWGVALRAFADNQWLGVGHTRFSQVYLSYVQDLSNTVRLDLAHVDVVDNMYLTTAVEHGLLGFVAQIGLLLYMAALLRRYHKELESGGLSAEASLVQCSELALVTYAVTGFFADQNLFTKVTKYFFVLVGLGLAAGARAHKLRQRGNGSDIVVSGARAPVMG
jgi:O-antigen ligase